MARKDKTRRRLFSMPISAAPTHSRSVLVLHLFLGRLRRHSHPPRSRRASNRLQPPTGLFQTLVSDRRALTDRITRCPPIPLRSCLRSYTGHVYVYGYSYDYGCVHGWSRPNRVWRDTTRGAGTRRERGVETDRWARL